MSVGESLLHALCAAQDTSVFFKHKLATEMFYGTEKAAFEFVQHHVESYHTLPQPDTLKEHFPNLAESVEPPTYYLDKVAERYKYKRANKLLTQCSELMHDQNVTATVENMKAFVSEMAMFDVRANMMEFGADSHSMVMNEVYKVQKEGSGDNIMFGWPYLDEMVNGLIPGDVVSYIGRPAVGKTWKLIYSALNAWQNQNKDVMILSMEMGILPIAQRLAALASSISISDLKKGFFSKIPYNEQEKLALTLKGFQDKPNKFHLINGNLTSTPDEIFALAHQLQPDVVFIDGAYLLKHRNQRLDRYTRVAENIEDIKKYTEELSIRTVNSYQFNRTGGKKKKNEEVDLTDIGYSDAIGQISSIVLGLFESDNVETIRRRLVRVLKGREGATGQFYVNWDFQNMDFSEYTEEAMLQEQNQPLGYL